MELVTLLSEESHVPRTEFGVRGSIALGMHDVGSDIDPVRPAIPGDLDIAIIRPHP